MNEEIVAAMEKFDVVVLQTAESLSVVCTCGVQMSFPIVSDEMLVRTFDDGVWKITSRMPIRCNIFKGAKVDVSIFVQRHVGLIDVEVVVPFMKKTTFIDAREGQHPRTADDLIACLSSQEIEGKGDTQFPFSLN